MIILIMEHGMQISVKNNKILTRIVKLVDGTPLLWDLLSDTCGYVSGKKELLFELLYELTKIYPGIIEII